MRSISVSDRAYVRAIIREMRAAIAASNGEPTSISTGPMDPCALEKVLDAACRASPQIRRSQEPERAQQAAPVAGCAIEVQA